MEPPSVDATLIERSLIEPGVFGQLYELHQLAVHRFVFRRVGPEAAEDLASEVFVRAFRGRSTCRVEHDSALPWLLGVANHVVADHRRVEKRRFVALERLAREMPETIAHSDATLGPELARALRRMPAGERDALLLLVWGELSYEEVATALAIPIGTMRSRVFRARRHLARSLGYTARTMATSPQWEGRDR